jgi:hypothetical protein
MTLDVKPQQVQVIEEAIRYIDQLHARLLSRLHSERNNDSGSSYDEEEDDDVTPTYSCDQQQIPTATEAGEL